MGANTEKFTVQIDKDLEEIAPGYLKNRWKDVKTLPQALEREDFDALRVLGHRMKGSGAGYGFDAITEIGHAIEDAAKAGDAEGVKRQVAVLTSYLERVEIVYA